ncbi:MAG: glycine cleavage system protein GcvH [Desulfobacteraceae bacterium]|jgi:glycine cleavage system H protein
MSKAIGDLVFPDDIRYSDDHEWARQEEEIVKVGITDYAQDQLGDIVYVELPEVGSRFSVGEEFGTLESVKAVSELFMPMDGEIVAINEALADTPERVNSEPYGGGWMIIIKPNDAAQFKALKDRSVYQGLLKGSE